MKMPKDKKTGETPTERNVAALNAHVLVLETENAKLIAERDEAVGQLKQANDLIEADTKARLVEIAAEATTMTLNDLAGRDIDDLEYIIAVSKMAKKPRFESGGDVAPRAKDKFNPDTHLHDLYIGNRRG